MTANETQRGDGFSLVTITNIYRLSTLCRSERDVSDGAGQAGLREMFKRTADGEIYGKSYALKRHSRLELV